MYPIYFKGYPPINDTITIMKKIIAVVEKFADDTMGIALAYADTESPTNQRKYGVWGYGANDDGQFLPYGLDTQSISKELRRETISAIFQYQPSDDLDIVVDYLNIDFADAGVIRGFIEPFSADAASLTGSGYNVSGTQIGANPVLRTDPENIIGTLETFGANIKFAINDSWTATVDVASSESTKRYERAESYAGLGRNGSLTAAQLGSREFQMSENGITFSSISGMDFSDFNASNAHAHYTKVRQGVGEEAEGFNGSHDESASPTKLLKDSEANNEACNSYENREARCGCGEDFVFAG